MKLKISAELTLPLEEFLTSTQAILAQKGKGKSYTASVQAEELLEARQQVVVIDPTGAWWGLRSSADGKSQGYPIAILGGEHADVPLEATAGEVIAEAIATEHFSAVIDLTLFRKAEALRFMAAFLETLYRKNRAALHLFIDEADVVAPQKTYSPEAARTLGAAEDIVRRGRIRGIGCTLISQRAQVINKDVLSQVDMLTTLGMNHPKDLGAIDAWVAVHGDPQQAKRMIESLPALPKGEAWVWAPATDLFKRVHIRARRTFDSGKTPKAGEIVRAPKVLAEVDIARLGASIAATVEAVKANDPKALKMQVVKLKSANETLTAQLAAAEAKREAKAGKVKTIERSMIKDGQLARIEALLEAGGKLITRWDNASADAHEALVTVHDKAEATHRKLDEALADLRDALEHSHPHLARESADATFSAVAANGYWKRAAKEDANPDPATPMTVDELMSRLDGQAPPVSVPPVANGTASLNVAPAKQRILDAIALLAGLGLRSPNRTQVALFAAQSPSSGGYANYLGALRSAGMIDYPSPGAIMLTKAGAEIADRSRVPGTVPEMHAFVRKLVGESRWRILYALIHAHPKSMSKAQLAEAAGASATSGGYANYLGSLRSLGLLDYPRPGQVRAEDILFLEAAS